MHDSPGAKRRRRKPVPILSENAAPMQPAPAPKRAPRRAPAPSPAAPISDVGMQTRQPARATPHQQPITETPQRYAARELHNPRPNPAEDLRVLGFVGASELTKSRARLQAYINALHRQAMQAQEPRLEQAGYIRPEHVAPVQERDYAFDQALAEHPEARATSERMTPLLKNYIIGKSLWNVAEHGHTSDPFGAALEAGMIFSGPFKLLGAGLKGAKAIKAGESAIEVARAARAGHAAPGIIPAALSPISKAAGRMKLRTFEIGGHTVQIPAAGSRSGRVIERAADRIRDRVPGLKSTAAKGGRELGYSVEHVEAPTKNTYANALKQASRRLSAPQEYALRIVAEGATPEERVAFHNAQAMIATRKDQVYYHALHADITEKAQKYIKLVHGPDGRMVPVLSDYAPTKLKRAWSLFQQAGDMREQLIKDMGLLSDEALARRIHAPARIINGARYKTFEAQIKDTLEASPSRKALFDAIDQTASTPQAASHDKTLWDAAVRSAASRAKLPPQELATAIDASYAHLGAVHTGITDASKIPGVALKQEGDRPRENFLYDSVRNAAVGLEPRHSNALILGFRHYQDTGEEDVLDRVVREIVDEIQQAGHAAPIPLLNLRDELVLPQSVKDEIPNGTPDLGDLIREHGASGAKEQFVGPKPAAYPGIPLLSQHTDESIIRSINNALSSSLREHGVEQLPHEVVLRNALDAGIQSAIKVDDYETAQVLHNALTKGTPGFEGDVPERKTLLQEQRMYGGPSWEEAGADSGRLFKAGRHPQRDYPFKSALESAIDTLPEKMSPTELLSRLKRAGVKDEEIKVSQFDKFAQGAGKSVTRDEVRAWFDSHYLTIDENIRSKGDRYIGEEINHPDSNITKFSSYTLPGGPEANYHELTIRLPKDKYGELYQNAGHFPDQNVLAHVRFTDRMVDGKRSLFIEEIQSDWHQAGQKYGYKNNEWQNDPEYQKLVEESNDLSVKIPWVSREIDYLGPTNASDILALMDEMRGARKYAGWSWEVRPTERFAPESGGAAIYARHSADGQWYKVSGTYSDVQAAHTKMHLWETWANRSEEEFDQRIKNLDQLGAMYHRRAYVRTRIAEFERRGTAGKVAEAPFKKTWHELAFKRMLSWAVDHGYGRVAWTTGAQQAERYDLANFVERLKVTRAEPDESEFESELQSAWDGYSEGLEHDIPYPDEDSYMTPDGEYDDAAFAKAEEDYYAQVQSVEEAYYSDFESNFRSDWEYAHQNDGFEIQAWEKGSSPDGPPDITHSVEEGDLEDYVGKDVAAKVHQGESDFSGDNLAVGEYAQSAQGASSFYDRKLTGFANKYLKKFKATVETRKLENIVSHKGEFKIVTEPGTGRMWIARASDGTPITEVTNDEAVAKRWLASYSESATPPPHGEEVHSIDITPAVKDFVAGGQPLFQRGGALEKVSKYGIKGALEIDSAAGQAVLHLTTAADDTTIAHELGHYMRNFLTDDVKFRQVAKFFGVKNGVWDRAAEEKFARSLEQVIRTGNGPQPIKEALRGLAPVFREVYDQADLPDVPPHVARFIQRLFEYDKKAGGSLVGADDLAVGVDYAPTFRGVPVRLSRPGKAFSAYMKRAGSGINHLFSGGRAGRAIGAGPQDAALVHEYQGSLLQSGFFTFDVTAPKIEASMLATKMSLAHIARKALVEAGHELPQSEFDFAVKVDPTKNVSKQLKATWAKINSLEAGKGDQTLLEGATHDLLNDALHSVIPEEIDGKRYSDVAREIMQTQRPVDNIVWVNPDFLEHSGLLTVPGASKASTDSMRKIGGKVMFGFDALNDSQKALVLYLNPAYVPMQFVGNIGMNVLQQGAFMPLNIWRSVILHREMAPWARVFMDTKMGTGSALALPMVTSGSKVLSATLGHWANVASDLLPRRLAFIHEARKLGLKPKHFEELFTKAINDDPEAVQVVDYITRRAKRAIVDFDRMSRFERETVTRFIWFYPWLRGATDYSVHFVADHPVQAIALAMAYEHLKVAQHNQLGDQPYFTKLDVPISTESLGLKVPGTGIDVGLNQAVGEHTATFAGGPQVFSLRQMLTQTTPLELAQSLVAFAGGNDYEAGADVFQHLTPIPYAAAVAGMGYDPFRRQQVPPDLATFFGQLTPTDSPIWQRYTHLNMSPEERAKSNERAMHPRSKAMEWERLFGGSLAPSGYNTRRAQELALAHKPMLARRIAKLKLDASDAGVPGPNAKVLEELTIKTKLDQAIHDLGKDPSAQDLAKTVASFFDQEYPGRNMAGRVSRIRTEGEATRIYEHLRPRLYRTYSHYQSRIDRLQARKAARTPVAH